ncbi:TetR/AcrR family transcriptional regulator [Budviciaceae bacterium BWR-B9]|uniref:TetR/AcrR family transcriptional regulator n=1 Tax=Limnobaculum allomyrinae TaxID=2791986 RepID=A0ABS1IKN8_9GAMM|nr:MULTISPECIES: TetR/AcrR family transcriptional regulator [Limnobaculum]MBK5142314.1 TetR/AcrR family transcriptional regulator [Limnobaculum allomyrinae]MBV7690801.1 TetR/AcrR family transcriptional regulator [Limnobaculum sp. M2-1]
MNRHPEHDTREHLLATGAQLCLSRGFTGMGLSEMLAKAEVPKGSFYHYFRSKEAFGVAMLDRHYALYNQRLQQHFCQKNASWRELIVNWYQQSLDYFNQHRSSPNCLVVKLSAEVCDLSEDMRNALDNGSVQVIAHLANALEKGRSEKCFDFPGEARMQAQVMYALWLGASLQAKISRSSIPLECAIEHVTRLLVEPVS